MSITNDCYDIAISYMQNENRRLAERLNNALRDNFRVFAFYEHKSKISGENRLDNFYYQLFLNRTNIVVLLYSSDYGLSGASRDEKDAIVERIANEKKNKWLLPVYPNERIERPNWIPKEMAFYNRESEGDEELIDRISDMARAYPKNKTYTIFTYGPRMPLNYDSDDKTPLSREGLPTRPIKINYK